ncbi:MAG: hypothetical protein KatS3mg060_2370 [Dehalococcoidia bacterium]|nr:MAG: hypothetical protein KatS3mg060_2370 [Dehalococcoidia bacterium]
MKGSKGTLPVAFEMDAATVRFVEWGGQTVELSEIRRALDLTPLFEGLPDNRCQCPHWGYVIRGSLAYHFADRTEVFEAGEVYYVAPGHLPHLFADSEYVEFSPADKIAETLAVIEQNMAKHPIG